MSILNSTTASAITYELQSENIKSQKELILSYFKIMQHQSYTSIEIDAALSLKNSHKRISELIREGLIMVVGRIKIDNRACNLYVYSSEAHREQLKKALFMQDFKAWVKQGERFNHLATIQFKLL